MLHKNPKAKTHGKHRGAPGYQATDPGLRVNFPIRFCGLLQHLAQSCKLVDPVQTAQPLGLGLIQGQSKNTCYMVS